MRRLHLVKSLEEQLALIKQIIGRPVAAMKRRVQPAL